MRACPMCGTDKKPDWNACICGYEFIDQSSSNDDSSSSIDAAHPLPDHGVASTILIGLGILTAAYAFFVFDPSVPSYSSTFATDRINNTGLLQQQMMTFIGGCALAIIGSIWRAAGIVAGCLRALDMRG